MEADKNRPLLRYICKDVSTIDLPSLWVIFLLLKVELNLISLRSEKKSSLIKKKKKSISSIMADKQLLLLNGLFVLIFVSLVIWFYHLKRRNMYVICELVNKIPYHFILEYLQLQHARRCFCSFHRKSVFYGLRLSATRSTDFEYSFP